MEMEMETGLYTELVPPLGDEFLLAAAVTGNSLCSSPLLVDLH